MADRLSSEDVTYDPAATFAVRETKDIYRHDADGDWGVRIYQPEGRGPFPALLSIHGGAWTNEDWEKYVWVERDLAACGLVVASIQLRLGPKYKYPASVADTNLGTRWLKAHARELNADPASVGTLGISSGGHLNVLSMLRPFDPRYAALPLPEAPDVDAVPRYVMTGWPVIDPWARFQNAVRNGRQPMIDRHYGYFVTDEAMQEGNPQAILDAGEGPAVLPPLLIVHGDGDTNVLPSFSQRFAESYRARGGEVELELFRDMPHAFLAVSSGPEVDRAVQVMKAFVARQFAPVAAAGRRI